MYRYHREEGSTCVPVAGIDDKRLLTAIQAYSMTVDFPPNHWANEDPLLQYLSKIILPFIEQSERSWD